MKIEQSELFKNLKISSPTPMLAQYLAIKAKHEEYLLFYRMGDFYELFFDDAIKAAPILEIILTSRGKHLENDIPMCGVPAHSYEQYLEKLIKAGFKVAICEQLESPIEAKKRGYKSVVKRDVVRIITPGTIIEESLLNAKLLHNLVSLYYKDNYLYIASADISTGSFYIMKAELSSLLSDLRRFNPKEIIISDQCYKIPYINKALQEYKNILSIRANVLFDQRRSEGRIKNFYKLHKIDIINDLSPELIITTGALIEYIEHTHKNNLPRLSKPKRLESKHFMMIDPATFKNLEIDISLSGERKKSLYAVIDKTLTPQGSRLLSMHLLHPLLNPAAINKRLDNIDCFIKLSAVRNTVCQILKTIPDFERIVNRIFTKKAGPRDLGSILNGLMNSLKIANLLKNNSEVISDSLKICLLQIGNYGEILEILEKALSDPLPIKINDGNFIKTGFNSSLDNLYKLKDQSENLINDLRDKYRKISGIPSLKIVNNKILGFFIEVTPSHVAKVDTKYFQHRQTLGSSIRYTTDELRKLELELLDSNEKIAQIEIELFQELCHKIENCAENIVAASNAIANIDVASSLAELAVQLHYTRPVIDESNNFIIEGGRHPVVESVIGKKFNPNSCVLNNQSHIWLITGPNMAGKSTFLRQNALICILAQMGSFVPVKKAHLGIVDKVFSRIGAADDISQGNSTFMVEMLETANILNNATAKSFVILDEVGRGTSTNDGLAIAWSVLENLSENIGCRTLFSTHYHELTELENKLESIACYTMRVKEWEGKVIFMHEVVKGMADRSHGLHVAEMAGLPSAVIKRAGEILQALDSKESVNLVVNNNANVQTNNTNIIDDLSQIDLDQISPKEAYDFLYNIKSKVV